MCSFIMCSKQSGRKIEREMQRRGVRLAIPCFRRGAGQGWTGAKGFALGVVNTCAFQQIYIYSIKKIAVTTNEVLPKKTYAQKNRVIHLLQGDHQNF